MKILVYGAGVLGSNLAAGLLSAGKDVTLLARGGWLETLKKEGLVIENELFHTRKTYHPGLTDTLGPQDEYDVIFVVLRYTQLDSVIDSLRESRCENIVFTGNNVTAEKYESLLPGKNVMFAFSLSAGHREKDRVVSVDLAKITIGERNGDGSQRALVDEIFSGTKYKVVYEPDMEDYLLCHAAFVLPASFACYRTNGELKYLRRDGIYLNRLIDANIEGYRAIERAGHRILPESDRSYESSGYRKLCLAFYRLMCATKLGKTLGSDHALHAADEMAALNNDLKHFFDKTGSPYGTWKDLEKDLIRYLEKEHQ